jgi:integrase
LPIILTQEEAVRLIDSASNLFDRAMLMAVYSTGMRRAEMCQLKVEDIDSDRMLIHIRQGKGRRDRDVPLSPKLLETLREYWRWMKPKTYLFPFFSSATVSSRLDLSTPNGVSEDRNTFSSTWPVTRIVSLSPITGSSTLPMATSHSDRKTMPTSASSG